MVSDVDFDKLHDLYKKFNDEYKLDIYQKLNFADVCGANLTGKYLF